MGPATRGGSPTDQLHRNSPVTPNGDWKNTKDKSPHRNTRAGIAARQSTVGSSASRRGCTYHPVSFVTGPKCADIDVSSASAGTYPTPNPNAVWVRRSNAADPHSGVMSGTTAGLACTVVAVVVVASSGLEPGLPAGGDVAVVHAPAHRSSTKSNAAEPRFLFTFRTGTVIRRTQGGLNVTWP